MTPRFKTDETGSLVPDLRAAAAIAFNPETGEVVWQENGTQKRSIASITKVMTALVFLEDEPDPDEDRGRSTQRRLRRVGDLPAGRGARFAERPAAPGADPLRQRRGPGARACVARRHGPLR
jgi:hypothetical protein